MKALWVLCTAWAGCTAAGWSTVAMAQDKPSPAVTPTPDTTHARLLSDLERRLGEPPSADTPPERVRHQLDEIVVDAQSIADGATDARTRASAMSIALQGLYLRLSRFPDDPQFDLLLFQMETAAGRMAKLEDASAAATGAFWQTMAQVLRINAGKEAAAVKRGRCVEALRAHLKAHPTGGPSEAIREMLAELDAPPKPDANSAADPTATTATPPVGPSPLPASDAAANRPALPPTDFAFELGVRAAITTGPGAATGAGVASMSSVPIRSRYQLATNVLRILEPAKLPPPNERTILIVLPVEAGLGSSWGDPLEDIRKLGLHDKHGLLVVMPTLTDVPWYADHPKSPGMRQESFIAKAVVPAIDKLYPSDKPRRLLLGFSKSGFGAMSLLLRYPELFAGAAVWDAPLMKDAPDNYGMETVFATQAVFDRYRLDHALRERGRIVLKNRRLVLSGYDHFQDHMQRAHSLMEQLGIAHEFLDGPQRRHHWETGWIGPAVEALLAESPPPAPESPVVKPADKPADQPGAKPQNP
jgi:hypothetical protein